MIIFSQVRFSETGHGKKLRHKVVYISKKTQNSKRKLSSSTSIKNPEKTDNHKFKQYIQKLLIFCNAK